MTADRGRSGGAAGKFIVILLIALVKLYLFGCVSRASGGLKSTMTFG